MRKGRAFTLIELLVVISVIALLLAVLMPALRKAKNQARAAVCQANLKQWATTVALYTENSEGHLPKNSKAGYSLWFLLDSAAGSDDPNLPGSLHSVDTKGIALCPMAIKPGRSTFPITMGNTSVVVLQGSTFEAWEMMRSGAPFRGSYGLNVWLFYDRFDESVPPRFRHHIETTNVYAIRNRGRFPLLADCTMPQVRPDNIFGPPIRPGAGLGMVPLCLNRHNAHINVLFLDWSVRKVGLKELWTLKWNKQFDTANAWTKAGGAQPKDWPEWMRGFKDY